MKSRIFSVIYLCILSCVSLLDIQAQETNDRQLESVRLSGRLVKKFHPAPRIVKNRAFGWFLELDNESRKAVQLQYNVLPKEDRGIFKKREIDLCTVQFVLGEGDVLERVRSLEGKRISVEGELDDPYLAQSFLCFSIKPDAVLSAEAEKHVPASKIDYLSTYFRTSSDVMEAVSNPLALPEGAAESLVKLTGKLVLRLFPGPLEYALIEGGDNADYCWALQLDDRSFATAISTPVGEPAGDLPFIMEWSNHREVHLCLKEDMGDFCCDHHDERVFMEGYLFHAHTAHHHAPLLMDVRKLSTQH